MNREEQIEKASQEITQAVTLATHHFSQIADKDAGFMMSYIIAMEKCTTTMKAEIHKILPPYPNELKKQIEDSIDIGLVSDGR